MSPDVMLRRWLLLLLLVAVAWGTLFALPTQLSAATVLIPKGAGWRFLDDGSNQGTAWKEISYDDDAWGFGHAELGFGDAVDGRPEVTQLRQGIDPDTPTITFYFRRFFYVDDAASYTNAFVGLLRDDGGVVYINGVEVFRSGMPDGPIDFETLASPPGAEGVDETRYFRGAFDPSVLVSGINLIAVEVHQVYAGSPDLSFDLQLTANQDPLEEIATLIRGPYLQLVTTNSIIVRWRTAEETTSRVQFGPAPDDLRWQIQDTTQVTDHEVSLSNLAPDHLYYYSVGPVRFSIAGGPDYFFYTAPDRPRATRIWAIGDCGTGTVQARRVFDQYRAFSGNRYTDVWLMLGDNAYGVGLDTEYQTAVFNQYPELLRQSALWSTMGNHETYSVESDGIHAYYKIFTLPTAGQAGGEPSGTEHYYSFDYSNIHFVCLDSEESDRTAGGAMLTWLEEDLSQNTKDWLIVFWHSPPYTKGSHDSDSPFDNFGNMIQMRENIVPILESHGADLVLCGHSHNYERSYLMNGHYGYSSTLDPSMILDGGSGQPGDTGAYLKRSTGPAPNEGTVYVVAGSAGFATFQVGRHPIMQTALLRMGSLVLDVNGRRLDGTFLRETGSIDDSFTLIKGAAAEPLRLTNLQLSNGNLLAKWKSQAGWHYVVQKATRLKDPDWTDTSNDIVATGATTFWSDVVNAGAITCFYRVVQVHGP